MIETSSMRGSRWPGPGSSIASWAAARRLTSKATDDATEACPAELLWRLWSRLVPASSFASSMFTADSCRSSCVSAKDVKCRQFRPTTALPKPSLRTKKYCSFINFGLHHYQPKSNSQPLHSAHPFHCTYVMYAVCFDFYCFYVLFHLHCICYSALGPLNWLIKFWCVGDGCCRLRRSAMLIVGLCSFYCILSSPFNAHCIM